MEYLDIYDEKGNSLGIRKSRKEAHELGLWHKSVHVWILNSENELLIQKRSLLKDNYPNMWACSAGGHISAGDNDLISVIKEVEEEIGLIVEAKECIFIGKATRMTKKEGYINNEINLIFIIQKNIELSQIKIQEEEVSEVKFIHSNELKKLIGNDDPSFVPHPEEYKMLFEFLEKNYGKSN